MTRSKLIYLFLFLLLLAFTGVTYAQGTEVTDDDVNRVARKLYCPICENTPLDVCETQACEDWRELIRQKLEAGQSDQEIVEYFAEIYGERARATPSTRGFSRWVWIVPLLGVVVGVFYFARLMRRWLARGSADGEAVPPPDIPGDDEREQEQEIDKYRARLERELYES